jgi:hypothetical protein
MTIINSYCDQINIQDYLKYIQYKIRQLLLFQNPSLFISNYHNIDIHSLVKYNEYIITHYDGLYKFKILLSNPFKKETLKYTSKYPISSNDYVDDLYDFTISNKKDRKQQKIKKQRKNFLNKKDRKRQKIKKQQSFLNQKYEKKQKSLCILRERLSKYSVDKQMDYEPFEESNPTNILPLTKKQTSQYIWTNSHTCDSDSDTCSVKTYYDSDSYFHSNETYYDYYEAYYNYDNYYDETY